MQAIEVILLFFILNRRQNIVHVTNISNVIHKQLIMTFNVLYPN